MFGISFAEFLIIIILGIVIIPAKHWPDVARFLANSVKFVRNLIWKITDASENIKEKIELQQPIDDLLKKTSDDVFGSFSSKRPAKKTSIKKSSKKTVVKNKK